MVTGSHQIKYRRDEDETILRHIRIFKTIHVSILEIWRKNIFYIQIKNVIINYSYIELRIDTVIICSIQIVQSLNDVISLHAITWNGKKDKKKIFVYGSIIFSIPFNNVFWACCQIKTMFPEIWAISLRHKTYGVKTRMKRTPISTSILQAKMRIAIKNPVIKWSNGEDIS